MRFFYSTFLLKNLLNNEAMAAHRILCMAGKCPILQLLKQTSVIEDNYAGDALFSSQTCLI